MNKKGRAEEKKEVRMLCHVTGSQNKKLSTIPVKHKKASQFLYEKQCETTRPGSECCRGGRLLCRITNVRDSSEDWKRRCGRVSDVYITTRLLPQPVYHSWGMRWTAEAHSNINKVSDPSRDDEFLIKMGFFAAGKGVTMVNQMAASGCMGLIRILEIRLKTDLPTDWIVFAIIAENSLFSADRKKENHKNQGRSRRGEEGGLTWNQLAFFPQGNQTQDKSCIN